MRKAGNMDVQMAQLLTIEALAEVLGLTYKQVYNRLDRQARQIVIAGRTIPATKDGKSWLVWASDVTGAQPVEKAPAQPQPVKTKQKPKPRQPAIGANINPFRSGKQ
jgi:hypothetical protein